MFTVCALVHCYRYDRCPACSRAFEADSWRSLVVAAQEGEDAAVEAPAGAGGGGSGGGVSGLTRGLRNLAPFLGFKYVILCASLCSIRVFLGKL
jgi:hypothetical protein